MSFSSQREAKKFLAVKIIEQAAREGAPLSEMDQRMLYYSVDEPETIEGFPEADPDKGAAYERKITGLLKIAYAREKNIPGQAQVYKDAYTKLIEGDHYLCVMAEPVLAEAGLSGMAGILPEGTLALRNIVVPVAIALAVMVVVAILWAWQGAP